MPTVVTTRPRLPSPQDGTWGHPKLPAWVKEFRPHQEQAVEEIMAAYARGAEIVLLSAPTGSGKSLLAEMVRRKLGFPCLYVPTTKTLQAQLLKDFDYAEVLMGRANYPTLDSPERHRDRREPLSGADCWLEEGGSCEDCPELDDGRAPGASGKLHCALCHPFTDCPYRGAKRRALRADLAIVNTAYFLSEANNITIDRKTGKEKYGDFSKREFTVLDECDVLESVLVDYAEVRITGKQQKQLGITPPQVKTAEAKSNDWLDWAATTETHLKDKMTKLRYRLKKEPELMEVVTETERLQQKITEIIPLIADNNVVYDGYQSGDIVFQPVTVAHTAQRLLWQHSKRWLLMSATLIPDELVYNLGIADSGIRYEVVHVPSTFPKENRPIIVRNAANMTFKQKATEWPKMVNTVGRVIDRYPGDRILVHTVSYDFTRYLLEHLQVADRLMVTYKNATERTKALKTYSATPGAVLLAPSMDRGYDFREDLARVVIICKVPWLNTSDKRVAQRIYSPGGQLWYATNAVRSIVQAAGRGVRSETDTCVSFILDAQFANNLWRKNRRLFPDYFTEALDFSGGGL